MTLGSDVESRHTDSHPLKKIMIFKSFQNILFLSLTIPNAQKDLKMFKMFTKNEIITST